MKRIVTFILLLGGATVVLAGMAWLVVPQAIDVDVRTVEVGEMQVAVDEDGQTRIRDTYVISAPFSGRLMRIRLEPGDNVVQGESILAVMTAPTLDLLDPRARAIAQARLAAASTAVEQTVSSVRQAEAALKHAVVELDRAEKLFEKRNLSEALRDNAALELQVRQQELRRAKLSHQVAEFELEQAQAALLQADDSADGSVRPQVEIRSPIDGQVLRVWQESEANVTAGAPLLELGQEQDLEIVVDVLSSDAVQIKPGAAALLKDWGGEPPLPARVRRVEPLGFTKVSALGVEEQRVNVILDFDAPVRTRVPTWAPAIACRPRSKSGAAPTRSRRLSARSSGRTASGPSSSFPRGGLDPGKWRSAVETIWRRK